MRNRVSPRKQLSAVLRRYAPLLLAGAAVGLLAALSAAVLLPAQAIAKAPIVIGADPDISISGSSAPSERLREADRFLRSEVAVLSSKELLQRAKNEAGQTGTYTTASIQRFGTDIVDLSVIGPNAKGASKVLESLLELYARERIEQYSRQTAVSIARLDARARQLRELAGGAETGAGDWEAYTTELNALSQTRATLGLRSVQREYLVRVVDKTNIGGRSQPRVGSNLVLLAGLTGLLAGLALAVARERLRDDVTTGETLSDFAGLPVLGTFAGVQKATVSTVSTASEAARIAHLLSALNLQRVMVVGTSNGQVASAVAEKLAAASAASHRPTVLFDATGTGHRRRDYDLAGLSTEKDREIDTLCALFRAAVDRHQPLVIANGTHLDQTVLPRPALAFFERIARDHGLVILDSEPLTTVGASLRWARDCDVVLVVDPSETTRSELASALHTLRLITPRIVGIVVVNGAESLVSDVRREPLGSDAIPTLRKIQI